MTMQLLDLIICSLCFILPSYLLKVQKHRRQHDFHKQKALIIMSATSFVYTVLLLIAITKNTTLEAFIGGFDVWLSCLQAAALLFIALWIRAEKISIKARLQEHRKHFCNRVHL